jgi:hypothetical protein
VPINAIAEEVAGDSFSSRFIDQWKRRQPAEADFYLALDGTCL